MPSRIDKIFKGNQQHYPQPDKGKNVQELTKSQQVFGYTLENQLLGSVEETCCHKPYSVKTRKYPVRCRTRQAPFH